MVSFNIFDYAIIIIMLYNSIPYIDWLIEKIGIIILRLSNNIGYLLIKFFKIVVISILYYLMALIYIFWFTIFFNAIITMCINQNYNIMDIFNEEYTDLTNKIYSKF